MVYNKSPFAHVHRTREWLLLDLVQTPDDRFNIIPDLKAAGYRHYLVVPIFFTSFFSQEHAIVRDYRFKVATNLDDHNVDLFPGQASFVDPHTISRDAHSVSRARVRQTSERTSRARQASW